jgi:hypothetical protein
MTAGLFNDFNSKRRKNALRQWDGKALQQQVDNKHRACLGKLFLGDLDKTVEKSFKNNWFKSTTYGKNRQHNNNTSQSFNKDQRKPQQPSASQPKARADTQPQSQDQGMKRKRTHRGGRSKQNKKFKQDDGASTQR